MLPQLPQHFSVASHRQMTVAGLRTVWMEARSLFETVPVTGKIEF